MNTFTHRLATVTNFKIFVIFFTISAFSFHFSAAQGCNWGAPTNLSIVDVGTESASIAWQFPLAGPAPGGYEVTAVRISNGNKMTYNVNNTSFVVPNLLPGVEYRMELRSICANGVIDPAYIAKNVITVVINDLVYPICPLPDSTVPVVGNLIPETIITSNTSPVTLTWPSFSPGTNRQIFYIEIGKVNTVGYKEKFVIVRDQGSNVFYYKHIGGYDQWKSKLNLHSYVKILDEHGYAVGKGQPSIGQLKIYKTSFIDQLKVKVDLRTSCDINNPQPLIGSSSQEPTIFQNAVAQEVGLKSDDSEININSDSHEITIFLNNTENKLNDILIYDISGRIIFKDRCLMNSESKKILIDDYASGIYVITVFNNDTFKQMKFIKL